MRQYTPTFIAHAKSFITDLLSAGGLTKANRANVDTIPNAIKIHGQDEAKTICDELRYKKFNFAAVDTALKALANWKYLAPASTSGSRYFAAYGDASLLADYLAWFCKQVHFTWDDTTGDPATMQQLKEYSVFGKALAEAHCYKSDPTPAATTTSATAKGTASAQPKNPYKSTGPQSGNARGLIGTPGHKETVNAGGKLYVCEFDKINRNVPSLFVAPLDAKGDAGNGVNKVMAGSANGYTDCTCYFATAAEADAFLLSFTQQYGATKEVAQDGTITYNYKKYTGLRVRTARNLPGFYKVKTTCGDAYINAKKLNEDADEENLVEAADEPISTDVAKTVEDAAKNVKSYNIYDIDVYEEAFWRYN